MRRLLFAVVLLAGCASSGAVPDPDRPTDRILATDEGQVFRTTDLPAVATVLPFPADRVMRGLATVYTKLGIDLTLIDPPTGRIGNPRFVRRREIHEVPISQLLNCGRNMTGNRSDNDRITMSLVSTARGEPAGGTRLVTVLSAGAQTMDGSSGDVTSCGTTGVLEETIRKQLLLELAGK